MDPEVLRDGQKHILANLELVSKHGLKRAACLLFAERPERYVSGAWIKIGFFDATGELRYQDEVHGDLFTQIETTLDLLRTKYLRAVIHYDGLQRVETWPYPSGALREALLNAVVHKDYASCVPLQIRVHDDQLVLWNSGQLPEQWTLQRLLGTHPSRPFNPLLANAFFRAGYIEAWGRGIDRIHRECRAHGIPAPQFEFDVAGVMVTFRASAKHVAATRAAEATPEALAQKDAQKSAQKDAQKTGRENGDGGEAALTLLRRNPFLTRADLARELAITPDAAKHRLEKLKAAGRLRRKGGRKNGEWEVLP
jgi:ATP-dependent DNA helicase RecG